MGVRFLPGALINPIYRKKYKMIVGLSIALVAMFVLMFLLISMGVKAEKKIVILKESLKKEHIRNHPHSKEAK